MLSYAEAKPVYSRASQILGSLPLALIIIQIDRKLLYLNGAALDLCASSNASQAAQRLMRLGQLDACRLDALLRQSESCHTVQAALWFTPGIATGWLQICHLPKEVAQAGEWPNSARLLTVQQDRSELSQVARLEALCRECRLSNAERYVLMLLADGMAVEAAATHLGLQVSTLRTHIRHLLDKTQANSLMQLLRWLGSAAALPQ